MKNLINLTGVHKLSKNEQQKIKGSDRRSYCGPPGQCCENYGNFQFCDYGYCMSNGDCIWA